MKCNRLKSCLSSLFFTILISSVAYAATQNQHLEVVIRSIGHEFLLQLNDSTSRILPIQKRDGRYALQFEREFSYEPDLLTSAALKVLEMYNIQENFIVEVEKCDTTEVVHSFEVSLKKDDNIIPCRGRELPYGCYTFYFTVLDKEAAIQPINQSDDSTSGFNPLYVILILLLVASLILYFKKYRKSSKLDSDFINIGQYRFDKKGMLLILKAQSTELSGKESELLYLFCSNENKTLEREYILNVVWGDDGDYVGRTLDVFVSKLRKKLEADSNIKIINIRGVGYRFVINK